MGKKTNQLVNQTCMNIARKCRVRISDVYAKYEALRELHISPKTCAKILNKWYEEEMLEYDKMMAEETI